MLDLLSKGSLFIVFAALVGAGMGLPISEDAVVLGTGALSEQGVFVTPLALLVCYAGVLLGDFIIFSVGRRLGPAAFERKFFQKILPEERRQRAEAMFASRGAVAVFISRFLVGFRIPAFATAGILQMSPAKFLLCDGLALAISAPAVFSLGYLFSNQLPYIQEQLGQAQGYVALGALTAVILIGVVLWARKRRKAVVEEVVVPPEV